MAVVRISKATSPSPGIVLWPVLWWGGGFCCFLWAFFFFFFLALVHCFYLHNHPLAEHKAKMRDGDHPVQFSSAEGLLSDQLTDGVHFVCAHFLSNSHAFISPNLRKEVCGYVTTYILSLNWSPKLFQKLYSS